RGPDDRCGEAGAFRATADKELLAWMKCHGACAVLPAAVSKPTPVVYVGFHVRSDEGQNASIPSLRVVCSRTNKLASSLTLLYPNTPSSNPASSLSKVNAGTGFASSESA